MPNNDILRGTKTYLGDAVYAHFDGFQVWLTTGDGNHMSIALEPEVLHSFDKWRTKLKYAIEEFNCAKSPPVDAS